MVKIFYFQNAEVAVCDPQVRTIKFLDEFYRLAFPFLIFVIRKDKRRFHLGFSPYSPIAEGKLITSTPLCYPPLPNMRMNFSMCLDQDFNPAFEIAEQTVSYFWNTIFTPEGIASLYFYNGIYLKGDRYFLAAKDGEYVKFIEAILSNWQDIELHQSSYDIDSLIRG